MFIKNVEALTKSEEDLNPGRYRTVACGGYHPSQWKSYCCPDDDRKNCPDAGSCSPENVVDGCD